MLGNPPPAVAVAALPSSDTLDVPTVANVTSTRMWTAPYACTLTRIWAVQTSSPLSALGTVVATVSTNGGVTNLLAAANIDLEALVLGTALDVPLTAIPADLILASGQVVSLVTVSNNMDMTAPGFVSFQLQTQRL